MRCMVRDMANNTLFRSSSFKLALTFLLLFSVAATIAGAAAFSIISKELEDRHEQNVAQDFALFQNSFEAGGRAELVEVLNAHIKSATDKSSIYLLTDISGAVISSNIDVDPKIISAGTMQSRVIGVNDDFNYFVKKAPLGSMTLIVGRSAEDIHEVEEVFFEGAFWAILLLTVISVSGGVALSTRMDRRIIGIENALEQVALGQFDAALPQSGKRDDIDRIALLMDGAIKRLGQSVEANRQISSDIAHDLKTPMNRLRICVENARGRAEEGLSVTDQLQEIDHESDAILRTFDALLRITQIESGARKTRFEKINLGNILADIAGFYQSHAQEQGASFAFAIAPNLQQIQGDRELLTQMIANLIENALKHAGENPDILCNAYQSAGSVVLSVSDNGGGIPEAERDRVTRRLYRLEKSRTTPGSGLGLSMVKAIAELHDAKLNLGDNEPGLNVTVAFNV